MMLTVPVEAWIGNAAAIVSGTIDAVTHCPQYSVYSPTAVYAHVPRMGQSVANAQATGISNYVYLEPCSPLCGIRLSAFDCSP